MLAALAETIDAVTTTATPDRRTARAGASGNVRAGASGTARVEAARLANWDQDERIAAVELGSRLGENPEAVVARLRRTSAGCDWMIGRWELLGNGLKTADEGKPDCRWTDADLALALNLLG